MSLPVDTPDTNHGSCHRNRHSLPGFEPEEACAPLASTYDFDVADTGWLAHEVVLVFHGLG